MNSNYVLQMNEKLKANPMPKILLQSCCAPCSSFCLLTLREVSNITVYYYNPNITDSDEYQKRYEEQKRLINSFNSDLDLKLEKECRQINVTNNYVNQIQLMDSAYDSDLFFKAVEGYEDCPERGERCSICFDLRLRDTAIRAKEGGFDMFATTLTLSPLKNADIINSIGERISKEIGIIYLPTDFKKKNGYKKSIELSKEYDLYRQDYCGCVFSMNKGVSV